MNLVFKAITVNQIHNGVRNLISQPTFRYLSCAPQIIDCWKCRHKHECEMFCPSCDTIQCTDCTTKKLSYFKLLDADETYEIDAIKLKQFYFQLQSVLHPDRFVNKSDVEQDYSNTQSALLTVAYKTLLDPLKRASHLLDLNGEKIDSESVDSKDMALLSDIFLLNFHVEETNDKEELETTLTSVNTDIESDIKNIGNSFTSENFDQVKEALIKLRYRTNIRKKIEDKLLQLSFK